MHNGSLFPTSLPIVLIHSWFHFCILYFLPSCILYIFASSASFLCVSSFISISSVLMVPWSCFLEVKPSRSFWRHQANILYNFFSSCFLPSSLPSSFSLLLLKAIFRYMLFCIFREHYLFHMFQDVLWITLWFSFGFLFPHTLVGNNFFFLGKQIICFALQDLKEKKGKKSTYHLGPPCQTVSRHSNNWEY